MKKLDLTVCMREKEYGQALARGLAYITPNLDITVCDAGYGNYKMAPGSVIITDDRGLTGENILQTAAMVSGITIRSFRQVRYSNRRPASGIRFPERSLFRRQKGQ